MNSHTNGIFVQGEGKDQSIKVTGSGYSKKTPEEKAKLIYARAIDTIKQNLHRMTPLKALLEIDLGGSDGPLYLDAREEPKLIATAGGEPDCQLKIKPEYVIQFAEGKLEPRYGLFKGICYPLMLASLTII
jgi:acid stress-induced BolA-like protein IbaG/YrbA